MLTREYSNTMLTRESLLQFRRPNTIWLQCFHIDQIQIIQNRTKTFPLYFTKGYQTDKLNNVTKTTIYRSTAINSQPIQYIIP